MPPLLAHDVNSANEVCQPLFRPEVADRAHQEAFSDVCPGRPGSKPDDIHPVGDYGDASRWNDPVGGDVPYGLGVHDNVSCHSQGEAVQHTLKRRAEISEVPLAPDDRSKSCKASSGQ